MLTLCTRLRDLIAQEAGCHAHLHHFLLLLLEVVSDIRGHTHSCGNIAPITDVCTHVCPFVMNPFHVVGVWATVLCVGTAHVHDTGPSSSSGAHHDIDVRRKTRCYWHCKSLFFGSHEVMMEALYKFSSSVCLTFRVPG